MTQTTDAALVERLRKRLAEASPQPWVYRPDRFDDWGWIRGTERDDRGIGPYRPVMAIARDSSVRDQHEAAHRAAGTDPYGPNALLITDAVNALPSLLDTIEAQARRIEALEGALRPFAKAGELFGEPLPGGYEEGIYNPAAGSEYGFGAHALRAARTALAPTP